MALGCLPEGVVRPQLGGCQLPGFVRGRKQHVLHGLQHPQQRRMHVPQQHGLPYRPTPANPATMLSRLPHEDHMNTIYTRFQAPAAAPHACSAAALPALPPRSCHSARLCVSAFMYGCISSSSSSSSFILLNQDHRVNIIIIIIDIAIVIITVVIVIINLSLKIIPRMCCAMHAMHCEPSWRDQGHKQLKFRVCRAEFAWQAWVRMPAGLTGIITGMMRGRSQARPAPLHHVTPCHLEATFVLPVSGCQRAWLLQLPLTHDEQVPSRHRLCCNHGRNGEWLPGCVITCPRDYCRSCWLPGRWPPHPAAGR